MRYVATAEDPAAPGLLMEVEVHFPGGRVLLSKVIREQVEGRL
ncbi:hypothetical protein [Thermanaeromonas sp. C210]|nr:hypothetical protein [Thermanaeromonas sp. C210]GFN22449.1 hypothetical protein TAMC210_07650 [Thermanaeromonas sp. C210]